MQLSYHSVLALVRVRVSVSVRVRVGVSVSVRVRVGVRVRVKFKVKVRVRVRVGVRVRVRVDDLVEQRDHELLRRELADLAGKEHLSRDAQHRVRDGGVEPEEHVAARVRVLQHVPYVRRVLARQHARHDGWIESVAPRTRGEKSSGRV